jgi:hypothetical protein
MSPFFQPGRHGGSLKVFRGIATMTPEDRSKPVV